MSEQVHDDSMSLGSGFGRRMRAGPEPSAESKALDRIWEIASEADDSDGAFDAMGALETIADIASDFEADSEPSAPVPDAMRDKRAEWARQAAVRYALGHSNLGEFINEVVEIPPSAPTGEPSGDALREAARRLWQEVRACWGMEGSAREAFGNTNYACVQQRLDAMEPFVSTPTPATQEDR